MTYSHTEKKYNKNTINHYGGLYGNTLYVVVNFKFVISMNVIYIFIEDI